MNRTTRRADKRQNLPQIVESKPWDITDENLSEDARAKLNQFTLDERREALIEAETIARALHRAIAIQELMENQDNLNRFN